MCSSPQPSCSTPRQPVTNHEGQFVPGRGPYGLVKPTPAPGEKLVEKSAVGAEQHRCRAHCPARASGNCLGGSRVMIFSEPNQVAADTRKRRLRQYPARRGCEYGVRVQHLARQVQPVSPCIFGEIAKYAGELQCPAEFCGNALARWRPLAKDPHRDPAGGDCHPLAIAVQLCEAGRPNVGLRVHFHAVDDSEEIVTLQTIEMYGFAQTAGHIMVRSSSIEMRNLTA